MPPNDTRLAGADGQRRYNVEAIERSVRPGDGRSLGFDDAAPASLIGASSSEERRAEGSGSAIARPTPCSPT